MRQIERVCKPGSERERVRERDSVFVPCDVLPSQHLIKALTVTFVTSLINNKLNVQTTKLGPHLAT